MGPSPRLPFLLGWALALAGCLTTTESGLPGTDSAIVLRGEARRGWRVEAAGEPQGSVVRYERPGEAERPLWIVRNVWGQDVGLIDALGRAWRWRPHAAEPELLGSGTVSEGVGRILRLPTSLVLCELPLSELARPPLALDEDGDSPN